MNLVLAAILIVHGVALTGLAVIVVFCMWCLWKDKGNDW